MYPNLITSFSYWNETLNRCIAASVSVLVFNTGMHCVLYDSRAEENCLCFVLLLVWLKCCMHYEHHAVL
jgi:hypothetical protein